MYQMISAQKWNHNSQESNKTWIKTCNILVNLFKLLLTISQNCHASYLICILCDWYLFSFYWISNKLFFHNFPPSIFFTNFCSLIFRRRPIYVCVNHARCCSWELGPRHSWARPHLIFVLSVYFVLYLYFHLWELGPSCTVGPDHTWYLLLFLRISTKKAKKSYFDHIVCEF